MIATLKDQESIYESRSVASMQVSCANYESILLQLIFDPEWILVSCYIS
jgi:hypothetical protein